MSKNLFNIMKVLDCQNLRIRLYRSLNLQFCQISDKFLTLIVFFFIVFLILTKKPPHPFSILISKFIPLSVSLGIKFITFFWIPLEVSISFDFVLLSLSIPLFFCSFFLQFTIPSRNFQAKISPLSSF